MFKLYDKVTLKTSLDPKQVGTVVGVYEFLGGTKYRVEYVADIMEECLEPVDD